MSKTKATNFIVDRLWLGHYFKFKWENNRVGSTCSIAYYNNNTPFFILQWTPYGHFMDTSWTPYGHLCFFVLVLYQHVPVNKSRQIFFISRLFFFKSRLCIRSCASNVCATTPIVNRFCCKRKQSGRKFPTRLLIITITHSKKEYNGGSVEDL